MSHITNIDLEIKELGALKQACQRLGLEFMEDQKSYSWYGRFVGDAPLPEGVKVEDLGQCAHAIKVPGAQYEVGVVSDRQGGYRLQWDYWRAGGLEEVLGKGAGKLKMAYGIEMTKMAARREGKSVYEIKRDNGEITLDIQGGF